MADAATAIGTATARDAVTGRAATAGQAAAPAAGTGATAITTARVAPGRHAPERAPAIRRRLQTRSIPAAATVVPAVVGVVPAAATMTDRAAHARRGPAPATAIR